MAYLQVGTMRFKQVQKYFEDTVTMRYFKHQIKSGYAPIVLVVGRQRTGKTFFAMYLAEQICKMRGQKFNVDNDMFFTVEDLAQRYDEGMNKVYILDEAGISLNVYEGNQLHQRVFQKIVESQAYRSNILVIVLPHARDVGSHHFHHVNVVFSMLGRGRAKMKHVSQRYDELSKKPPFVEDFEVLRDIPEPSKEVTLRYLEVGQQNFKQEILNSQIAQLREKAIIKAGKPKIESTLKW